LKRLLFDIETDGFDCNWINCLVIKDVDTGKVCRFRKNPEEDSIGHGVEVLNNADLIIGHNIIAFDIPALQKTYNLKPKKVFDTLNASRLIWTDLKGLDYANIGKGTYPEDFPKKFIGSHSLQAWGIRLRDYKDDFKHKDGQVWSQRMEDYCVQDVESNFTLWQTIEDKNYSAEALQLEMDVQEIIVRQKARGVTFNTKKAQALYSSLVKRKLELEKNLRTIFPPFYVRDGKVFTPKNLRTIFPPFYVRDGKVFTPKQDNKRFHYYKGCKLVKIKLVEFNPGSRDHIADRLIKIRGWEPIAKTDKGKPKVDETIVSQLPYPEAAPIAEYLMIVKRIGQVGEGNQAWLKQVTPTGKIHGSVITNGARTGRMTHMNPNLAQVPKANSHTPYGPECRDCFEPTKGYVLVGADASGLELRNLAHYMAKFDGGEYVKVVLRGDAHSRNQKAAGLDSRDKAKRWFYALIYGAGNMKLGAIVNGEGGKDGKASAKVGGAKRKAFMNGLPAFGQLYNTIQGVVKKRGYLLGLDGRHLSCPSLHSALNTLLQSAGAIIMKKALVLCDRGLQMQGYVPGEDYEFVLNVHDEFQIEAKPEIADIVGQTVVRSIKEAGDHFNFRCPLDGEYKIGRSWKETH
jgi:DNA polymerase I-like protein with 3'-5' exonuclease and polymerase domains